MQKVGNFESGTENKLMVEVLDKPHGILTMFMQQSQKLTFLIFRMNIVYDCYVLP